MIPARIYCGGCLGKLSVRPERSVAESKGIGEPPFDSGGITAYTQGERVDGYAQMTAG